MPVTPPLPYALDLFPPGSLFDMHGTFDFTMPCNFMLHFEIWSQGTAAVGKENGQLLLDSWTCQAVTPRDEDWVDYYYAWGLSDTTDGPGMTEMLIESETAAFLEDQVILEAQYERLKARPDGNKINIKHDAGPNRMLALLDRYIDQEKTEFTQTKNVASN